MNKSLAYALILAALLLAGALGIVIGRRSLPPPAAPAAPPRPPAAAAAATATPTAAPGTPGGVLPSAAEGFHLYPDSVDLGELLEGQGRRFQIRLERPAGTRVRLAGVKTSCPCLQFVPRSFIIAPDAEAVIEFNLHTLTMSGAETKRFVVEVLEPRPLTLTGEVRATVKRVPAKLLLVPAELHLGLVREPADVTAKLWNLTKRNVTVGEIQTPGPGFALTLGGPQVIPGGQALELRLRVTPAEVPAGPLRGNLIIASDLPEHTRLALPLDGTVVK